jgi:hypothetical protein
MHVNADGQTQAEFHRIISSRKGYVMQGATFRKWLVEQGCRLDSHQHPVGHEGHGTVTAHREGRTAQIPLTGAHHELDPRVVRQVCKELGLDPSQLPGPQSRA